MISVQRILKYLPAKHGEHGVDSVIHRIIRHSDSMFESYCNPPGASWAQIIVKNQKDEEYAWDHIPRKPNNAKRPDHIIQFNESAIVNFLAIESKGKITNIGSNINVQLKNFFSGNQAFSGLLKRPMWYKKNTKTRSWKYIKENKFRYWLNTQTIVYSGFAFSFIPETYDCVQFNNKYWLNEMRRVCDTHSLDIVIGVGWSGKNHMPFTRIVCGKNFAKTTFGQKIKNTLSKNSSI